MTLLIVGIYFAVLLGIGWWSYRTRISGMTDFLLAGRKLGLVLCSAAMAATHFGGGALMGGAAWGFEHGLSGAWYGISTGLGLVLLAWFTAGKFRALALYTVPDFLARRYGGNTVRVIGALLSLVALTGILAAQVNAARGAFAILGVEGPEAAVLATLVFVAYTAIGGLWAATISDLVQIVIAGVGIVIAAAVVWSHASKLGGLAEVLAAKDVGEGYLSLTGAGPELILWLVLPTVMYTLIGQDFYQRLFAARDAGVARRSALLGGIFLIVISFFPTLVGIGARAFSDIEDRTMAVPWVLQNLFDPLIAGVILAAILAAIMSSADSLLTAATSHLVKDLWIETLGRGDLSQERQLLKISRASTVAVGIVALLIGLATPGIVTILIYSYTLYTAGVFVPMLGGVVWRRATRAGALAAMIGGSAIALVGIVTGADLGGVPTEIYAALVSAVLFVTVSLLTKSSAPAPSR
ncbi:MAG: sodium:solute symporter family protein [Thermoanaerobaculia bacterium]